MPCLPYFSEYFVETLSFSALIFFFSTASISHVNCPSLMSSWPLIISLGIFFQCFQEGFKEDSWNILSSSDVFLLGWQFLILFSMCFSFDSLYLQSAILFVVVYLQPSSWFYWFCLRCILIILFGMFYFCPLWAKNFVGFLLLSKDTFSYYAIFSKTTIDSHWTLLLVLRLHVLRCWFYSVH